MTQQQVTPPPPVSILNSAPPDHPHHTAITLDEPPKPEILSFPGRILDAVKFFLLGFVMAFWMGIVAIALAFFYRRLHVTNLRRKISFGIGHVLGTIGGLVWQGWVVFLLAVVIPSNSS